MQVGRSGEREVTDVGRRRPVGIRHLGADLEAQEAQHVAPSAAQIVHSIVNPGQWDHFRVRVRMDQLRFSPLFSVNRTESFVIVVYLTTFRM